METGQSINESNERMVRNIPPCTNETIEVRITYTTNESHRKDPQDKDLATSSVDGSKIKESIPQALTASQLTV